MAARRHALPLAPATALPKQALMDSCSPKAEADHPGPPGRLTYGGRLGGPAAACRSSHLLNGGSVAITSNPTAALLTQPRVASHGLTGPADPGHMQRSSLSSIPLLQSYSRSFPHLFLPFALHVPFLLDFLQHPFKVRMPFRCVGKCV